jgi:hypothetical protein
MSSTLRTGTTFVNAEMLPPFSVASGRPLRREEPRNVYPVGNVPTVFPFR